MRAIGKLANLDQAEKFYYICLYKTVEVHFDKEETEPTIWALDDEHIGQLKDVLSSFASNPEASQWQAAIREGSAIAKIKQKQAVKAPAAKSSSEPSYIFTYSTLVFCFLVFALDYFDPQHAIRQLLAFSTTYFVTYSGWFNLPEIQSGQIWRLVTPIFLHGNLLHLIFNMIWFYQLGRQLEDFFSKRLVVILTLSIAILSHIAFFLVSGPSFVGMSGVIYGYCTFLWAMDRYDPTRVRGADLQPVTFLMYWYVFCLALTVIGLGVANTIHGVGALVGYLAGVWVSKSYQRFRLKDLKDKQNLARIAMVISLVICGMLVDYLSATKILG